MFDAVSLRAIYNVSLEGKLLVEYVEIYGFKLIYV